jgi:signal peptidase I
VTARPSLLDRSWLRTAVRRVLDVLWLGVVPALLSGIALRYLVPVGGHGLAGLVSAAARAQPVWMALALYAFFGAMAFYWRSQLPAGLHPSVDRGVTGRRRMTEAVGLAVLALAVAAGVRGVRAFLVEQYEVVGESMLPTFESGDRVAGDKLAYSPARGSTPRRGDVVVFASSSVGLEPGSEIPGALVKRVIGLPGDRIEMHDATPVINGWPVPTCDAGEYLFVLPDGSGRAQGGRVRVEFLDGRSYLVVSGRSAPSAEPYVVKPGEFFVLGDNRSNSVDSRTFFGGRGGGVPFAAVQARVDRFLVGSHRGGGADFGRFFGRVDDLQSRLRLEGLDVTALQGKVARCLENRPSGTNPPPPSDEASAFKGPLR